LAQVVYSAAALDAVDQITKASDILSGYLALYHFEATRDVVAIDRIRHQREAGYRD
jgi:hypothetical protein